MWIRSIKVCVCVYVSVYVYVCVSMCVFVCVCVCLGMCAVRLFVCARIFTRRGPLFMLARLHLHPNTTCMYQYISLTTKINNAVSLIP